VLPRRGGREISSLNAQLSFPSFPGLCYEKGIKDSLIRPLKGKTRWLKDVRASIRWMKTGRGESFLQTTLFRSLVPSFRSRCFDKRASDLVFRYLMRWALCENH